MYMSPIMRLMRPKQWVKNIFVLAPLLFSGLFTNLNAIKSVSAAFIIFCLASSATYVLNDYRDIESDKKHPVKSKSRPLASGEVTKRTARAVLASLYCLIAISAFHYPNVVAIIGAYLLLNIAYTFYLKHQPVFDIFTIATGFVLRVLVGAVSISVPLSSWMFITTLSLALYLAAVKRRQELLNSGTAARGVLESYSLNLVDKYAEMSATCAILFYSLFVMSDKPDMAFTIPIVLFGLFRYWYVVEMKASGDSSTEPLFTDKLLQLTILIWIGACYYSLSI